MDRYEPQQTQSHEIQRQDVEHVEVYHLSDSSGFWTAAIATLVGATFAFLLEAMRRSLTDRRRQLAAGNEVMVALSQMQDTLATFHDDVFVREADRIEKIIGRKPVYYEFRSITGFAPAEPVAILEKLGFLVRSYDPDVLNRVMIADRIYRGEIAKIREHTRLNLEFQRRMEQLPLDRIPVTARDVPAAIGASHAAQLQGIVESLMNGLPGQVKTMDALRNQLHDVLSHVFPLGRVVGVTSGEIVHVLDRTNRQPPRWRRYIRRLVRFIRKGRTRKPSAEPGTGGQGTPGGT